MPCIESRGLRKAFGATVALDSVNLRVEEGRILGLIGPNGAGKTALVMAIDAKLLVLDEPTLGLDILYRKQFYDSLLNDYFDRSRTIVVTTHQVEEIEDVLTDVMFIDRGRIVLDCSMDALASRYAEVLVQPDQLAAARAHKPLNERQLFGRGILLFEHVDREMLGAFGEVRTPSLADLFVAVMESQSGAMQGAA